MEIETLVNLVTSHLSRVFEKYSFKAIDGIVNITSDIFEKIKVDTKDVFNNYIVKSYEKYSKVKTILYKAEPKDLYSFFEPPNIKVNNEDILINDVNKILNISHFIIISGTGGIGKSILMKFLFIDAIKSSNYIPIFFDLKDINDYNNELDITDIILQKINSLGCDLKKEYFQYALNSGLFLFLFDGYDEIRNNKQKIFFNKFEEFCDKYDKNYFIVSSRPYSESEFVEFQRFSVVRTQTFSKEQVLSLISKIDYDEEIKDKFLKALDKELYDIHKSFASNPLLLNIMLLTYDNYAEIPKKLHIFYNNAFETLYLKHDATKSGYKRVLKSNLAYDEFKKVFTYLCFLSYYEGKLRFLKNDLFLIMKNVKEMCGFDFKIEDYIYDLINSICVLHKEGEEYKFVHRSFQEYFAAVFLMELTDDKMKLFGKKLIEKDVLRAYHDQVFILLYDMACERFENNILLSIIEEFEKNNTGDKYDFYFKNYFSEIRFLKNKNGDIFIERSTFVNEIVKEKWPMFFISKINRNANGSNKIKYLENYELNSNIYKYLVDNRNYKNEGLSYDKIYNDKALYSMMKKSCVGVEIQDIILMKQNIEKKNKTADNNILKMLN